MVQEIPMEEAVKKHGPAILCGAVAVLMVCAGVWWSSNHPHQLTPKLGGSIVDARDWNSDTKNNADGTKTTAIHGKWINYKGVSDFLPIDTNFTKTGSDFSMTEAPFQVSAPLFADGIATFKNNNRFDPSDKSTITDPELDMDIKAVGVGHVAGQLVTGALNTKYGVQTNVSYVLYPSAYASGADLIYYVDFGVAPRLLKLVRFKDATEILNPTFDVRLNRAVTVDLIDKTTKAVSQWDNQNATTTKHLSFKTSEKRGISFVNFQVWDSATGINTRRKVADVPVSFKLISGWLEYTKNIPIDFAIGATFPLFTDTTTSFLPDANPETTSVDGWVRRYNVGLESYATIVAGAGTEFDDSTADDSTNYMDTNAPVYLGTWRLNYRYIMLFDTSSIPDTDVISSATFVGTGFSKNDAYGVSIVMTSSAPASNIALATGDYATMKQLPKQSNTVISLASFNAAGTNTWTLNSTGLGNISKTGVSKFGLQFDSDQAAVVPSTNMNNLSGYGYIYNAEHAGTASDPTLTVTYAPVAILVAHIRLIKGAMILNSSGANVYIR